MKSLYLISIATAALIFSGCGDSSDSTPDTISEALSNTITVERGPILGATVIDANGVIAKEDGNGKYTFASKPSYPVMATGGVIDIDRDGSISVGDVVNDMNLTTVGGDVVTIATTLATNTATRTQLEQIASDLNITLDDIFTKTPQESKEIEAISNVLYKYVKENNISNMLEITTTQLLDMNTSMILNEYNRYVSDADHDSEQEEKDLVDYIKGNLPTAIDTLDNDAEVESEITKLDDDLHEYEPEEIASHLLTLKHEYELEYGDLDYDYEDYLDYYDDEDANHNQGANCAACHSPGTTTYYGYSSSSYYDDDDDYSDDDYSDDDSYDNDEVFDSGATIFTSLTAANDDITKAAYGYSVQLLLNDGTTVNYKIGNGIGNVNATFNAGITTYTAQVINTKGEVVNSSLTNSHDASRFDCNSCHTATGANGAPGRITSFQYTIPTLDTNTTVMDTNMTVVDTNTTVMDTNMTVVDTNTTTTQMAASISFSASVLPILQTNCQTCHGASGNFSITTSVSPYAGVIPFVDTANAENSALLMKATNTTTHGGGVLFNTTSTEYTTIRDWISQGALDN